MSERSGDGFARWARWIAIRRRSVIGLSLAASIGLASGIGRLEVKIEPEDMIPVDSPLRIDYDRMRQSFDSDETVMILVETPDLFSREATERLRDFHRALEDRVPHVAQVDSLINARTTRGTESELILGELFEPWPRSKRERALIRVRALGTPAYESTLLTRTGEIAIVTLRTSTSVDAFEADELDDFEGDAFDAAGFDANEPRTAPLLRANELAELSREIRAVRAEFARDDFRIVLLGGPILAETVVSAMERDMALFTGLSFAAIAALLALLFRRVQAVVLPLFTVALPLVCTFGAMGWASVPVTPATQIIPSFLAAVGVANSVHLLGHFFRAIDSGTSAVEALADALSRCGLAAVYASLTTAAGLFSFYFSGIPILDSLGASAPFGVLMTLVFSLTLLPALLCGASSNRTPDRRTDPLGGFHRAMKRGAIACARKPAGVIAIWLTFGAAGLYSAADLEFENDSIRWFEPGHELRRAFDRANSLAGSSDSLTLYFDTGRPGGLYEPETLGAMEEIAQRATRFSSNGVSAVRAISILDVVKETHQALNANDPERHSIPSSRALIAQELLLFENAGPDELDDFVDSSFQLARMTLLINKVDDVQLVGYADALARHIESAIPPDLEVSLTGRTLVGARSISQMLSGMARSYGIALILISPVMILVLRSVRRGVISMIPNITPIVIALGVMQPLAIELDLFTILIASIAIGIAVDDTIHFMHAFRLAYEHVPDVERAVGRAIETVGRALMITSCVLCFSFLVFTAATMINVRSFGIISAICVTIAFLADITLAPALVAMVSRRRVGMQWWPYSSERTIRAAD